MIGPWGDGNPRMSLGVALLSSILPIVCTAICVFMCLRTSETIHRVMFGLFGTMAILQAASFIWMPFSLDISYSIANLFLLCSYFSQATIVGFVNTLNKRPLSLAWFLVLPFCLCMTHTLGYVTEGFAIKDGSPMHVDGQFYYLADIYYWLTFLASMGLVAKNIRDSHDDERLLSKNLIFLLSHGPMLAILLVVVALSTTEYAMSLRVIGPLMVIYMALVMAYLTRHQVIAISRGVIVFRRLSLLPIIMEGNLTHNEGAILKELERQKILEALAVNDDDRKAAADEVGMSRSTLYRKLKAHGISNDESV